MRQESTRPPLVFQVTIAAPPEAVFDTFFATPQRWLCRSGGLEPRIDGRVRLCWPDGCVAGRLVQHEPPRTARFTWRWEGDALPETIVVVGLGATARGGRAATRLELEHYGFGVGADWDLVYLGAARAWAGYLKNLRAVLETGVDLREDDE